MLAQTFGMGIVTRPPVNFLPSPASLACDSDNGYHRTPRVHSFDSSNRCIALRGGRKPVHHNTPMGHTWGHYPQLSKYASTCDVFHKDGFGIDNRNDYSDMAVRDP
ncbi:hypothetical protein AX14_009069 [Amanita brunnescens Koide BX004]|nr:hypothetical protein AX14_009069 [Amanita brunnescens Koide BX004]